MTIARRAPHLLRPYSVVEGALAVRSLIGMFAVVITLAVALMAGAAVVTSAIWAFGALLVFILFAVLLAKTSPFSFIMLAPLIVLRLTEFMSGAAIENGAYMSEPQRYGYASGAFARLLFIDLLFFALAATILAYLWPRIRQIVLSTEPVWVSRLWLVRVLVISIIIFCSAMIAVTGARYGFPLLTGEDRFAYLRRVDFFFYKPFLLNRAILTPFFGLLLTHKKYRKLGIFSFVWLIAASLLFAEKFTSLTLLTCDFLVPLGVVFVARGGVIPVKAIVLTGMFMTALTVPAVLLVYGAQDNLEGAISRFQGRFAQQGELWFLADAKFGRMFAFDGQAIRADIRSWFLPSEQTSTGTGTKFGLYYVMQDYAGGQELRWIMEGGNGFVFATLPYLLKATGYVGLVLIMSIMASYSAFLFLFIILAAFQVNVLAMVMLARVSIFMNGFYIVGYFWNAFGVKTLAALLLAIIALMIGHVNVLARLRNMRAKARQKKIGVTAIDRVALPI